MRIPYPSVGAASFAFLLVSCGDGNDVAAAGGAAASASSPDSKALGIAFGLPRVVATAAYQSRSTVAEAIYFACSQTNSLQSGGETQEFESIQANGSQTADTAITWLQSPHRLA
jgi:hypothetical protein